MGNEAISLTLCPFKQIAAPQQARNDNLVIEVKTQSYPQFVIARDEEISLTLCPFKQIAAP
jgi:hypothetical protein